MSLAVAVRSLRKGSRLIEIGYWAPAGAWPRSGVRVPAASELVDAVPWLPARWLQAATGLVAAGLGRLVDTGIATARPRVEDHVDPSWSAHEREECLAYMAQEGRVHESWYGESLCRLCGCRNGSRDMTDGVFVWPEGFPHYLREHQVKPPDPRFLRLVLPTPGLPADFQRRASR